MSRYIVRPKLPTVQLSLQQQPPRSTKVNIKQLASKHTLSTIRNLHNTINSRPKHATKMAMSRNVRIREQKRLAAASSTAKKIKMRLIVNPKPIQQNSEPARVYPASTHHRPSPYTPTLQHGGHYPKERGNAPGGVSDAEWAKAFNNANSYIFDREPISCRIAVAKRARQDGLIRDLAIERLIAKGGLSQDFVDAAP